MMLSTQEEMAYQGKNHFGEHKEMVRCSDKYCCGRRDSTSKLVKRPQPEGNSNMK